MRLVHGLSSLWRKLAKRPTIRRDDPGIQGLAPSTCAGRFEERWRDLKAVTDFRPDDIVLEVGSAEGVITLEVARLVRSVVALELDPGRVEAANRLRQARGITNVTFHAGSITNTALAPDSYDVVLFLGWYHDLPAEMWQSVLEKLLNATRRQVVIRTTEQRPSRLDIVDQIVTNFERRGFQCICVGTTGTCGGRLIVANRGGADVRTQEEPKKKAQEKGCN